MAIACVYCGGEHQSASQVRQCWVDHDQIDVAPSDAPPAADPEPRLFAEPVPRVDLPPRRTAGTPARPAGAKRAPSTRSALPRGAAPAGPGPDALGRHALVTPGDDVPSPWSTAPRLVISDATLTQPADAIAVLRAAHHRRDRLVIELATDLAEPPHSATDLAPYELGPRFSFELDELFHLVWSNTVDLRSPDRPVWIGLDAALHAGARPATDPATADVLLPSGEAAWLDGGPIRHTDPIDGVPVLSALAVEHGSLVGPGPNTSDADLAPDQLAAVTHAGGVARIIAPAGSGKTRVLTERARHLLTRWQLPPSAVSLVAFNKRAQEEMTERTADLPQLQVRTLNAIALAIVNGSRPFAPQQRSYRTIDEIEVRRIIGDLVTFPRRRNSDPVAPWIEALSLIRLGLLPPAEVESRYDGEVEGLVGVWPLYRQALERSGAVDFDDQIYRALLVLLTQPDARHAAQRASRMMLVDEFQDLTPAHLLLIRLLSSPGGAVFGVGDDDQTIYGYNGADPAWLIDFAELFPGAGSHPLEVNYRCPAGVVDVVDRLLRHNTRRVPKQIRAAASPAPGPGWSLTTSNDPVADTVAAVAAALDGGAAPTDVAVLSRVNAILAPVQVALVVAGVPIAGGVGLEFAERTAVKTVLSWIRLATAGNGGPARFDPGDLREALRRPSRSFHPRINDWVTEQASLADLAKLAERLNNEKDTERVLEFAADIATLQALVRNGAPTADLLDALVDDIGLAGAVTSLDAHRRGMNRAAQGDDLTALRHLAELHDDPRTFGSWLRTQLAVRRSPEGVMLSTVHRVKGQEWPHVVVHLADAEQYPHRLAEDVEEERRLFHVALTRAARHATVVTGPRPSPFVDELTTEPEHSRPVTLHRPEPTAAPAAARTVSSDPSAGLADGEHARYLALCELRHELRDGKPAYVVFDNKTAVAIAKAAPTNRSQLLRVPGIGPAKADKYGDAILAVVQRHR